MTLDCMPNPHSHVTSVDNFCGRWILKQKEILSGPPTLGTTFPPFPCNLPNYQESLSNSIQDAKPRCKCLSETDLSHLEKQSDLQESSSDSDGSEEDYLFEFDIEYPASDEDGENNIKVRNVSESLEIRRISSSSSSSCTSRIEGSTDGFSEIFSSTHSGPPITTRGSTSGASDEMGIGITLDIGSCHEGIATPILAASPQVDSPIVSPDSCLDEDSILDDHNLCEEYSNTHASSSSYKLEATKTPEEVDNEFNQSYDMTLVESSKDEDVSHSKVLPFDIPIDSVLYSRGADVKRTNREESPDNFQLIPDKIEIKSGLHVSSNKLASLLSQLENEKGYPNQEEEQDELIPNIKTKPERPRLRKSSSLKASRSCQTASGRKSVRFADILGLDLSQVKIFSDEIPRIPKTAFEDLDVNISEYEDGCPHVKQSQPEQIVPLAPPCSMVPMFNQPGSLSNFFDLVYSRKVCLENAFMDGSSTLSGVVRVLNISFSKTVVVRWSIDEWVSLRENKCDYLTGSTVGNTDQFKFRLNTGKLFAGTRVQLCLRYECEGDHWDNNGGSNYVFQVFQTKNRLSNGHTAVSITSFDTHFDNPWMN